MLKKAKLRNSSGAEQSAEENRRDPANSRLSSGEENRHDSANIRLSSGGKDRRDSTSSRLSSGEKDRRDSANSRLSSGGKDRRDSANSRLSSGSKDRRDSTNSRLSSGGKDRRDSTNSRLSSGGKKPFSFRRAAVLFLATVVAFAVLEAGIAIEAQAKLSFSFVTAIYYIAATVLIIAVILLNHGTKKGEFTPDMLRDDLPEEEARQICDSFNRHKRLARRLMLPLIPIILAILLDFVYIFYGDMIAGIFSAG